MSAGHCWDSGTPRRCADCGAIDRTCLDAGHAWSDWEFLGWSMPEGDEYRRYCHHCGELDHQYHDGAIS